MADTFDRMAGNITVEELSAGVTRIPAHSFASALQELADGAITRAQLEAAFGIPASDSDLDFLIAQYQAKSNKIKFLLVLENLFILAENGLFGYNVKATFAARIQALP